MILVRYVSAAIRGRRKVVLTEPVPDEATAASDPIRQKITHLAGDFVVRKDADIISTYRRKLGPRVSVVDHGEPTAWRDRQVWFELARSRLATVFGVRLG
jgi:hypothetical protein